MNFPNKHKCQFFKISLGKMLKFIVFPYTYKFHEYAGILH